MKKSIITLGVAVIVLVLWVIASRKSEPRPTGGDSTAAGAGARAGTSGDAETVGPRKSKGRVREDDPTARKRKEFQDRFDALLPPLDPGSESAICEVELQPGEGIVMGGFKMGDGRTKVSYLTPLRVDSGPAGVAQYELRMQSFLLDDAALSGLGLDALSDGGRMRQQQFTTSPEMRAEAADSSSAGKLLVSLPTVITQSDQRFTISTGKDGVGDSISGIMSPVAGGEGVILRARMENDGRLDP